MQTECVNKEEKHITCDFRPHITCDFRPLLSCVSSKWSYRNSYLPTLMSEFPSSEQVLSHYLQGRQLSATGVQKPINKHLSRLVFYVVVYVTIMTCFCFLGSVWTYVVRFLESAKNTHRYQIFNTKEIC